KWKSCDCPTLNYNPEDPDPPPGLLGLPFGIAGLFGFNRQANPDPNEDPQQAQIREDERLARRLANELNFGEDARHVLIETDEIRELPQLPGQLNIDPVAALNTVAEGLRSGIR